MPVFSKILVPIDFSVSSRKALALALLFTEQFNAHLLLLHVVAKPISSRGYYLPELNLEDLETQVEEGARKRMEEFCNSHLPADQHFEWVVVNGRPAEQIVEQARRREADLVVIGTHGRSGLDHALIGSTAEKVVRFSRVPVLTVRMEEASA